jgi:hypothetical protein
MFDLHWSSRIWERSNGDSASTSLSAPNNQANHPEHLGRGLLLDSCVFISFALKYESVKMQLNADAGIFGDIDIFGNERRLSDDFELHRPR